MDENGFGWDDSWALLALFAMAAGMNKSDAPEEQPMIQLRTPETMSFSETNWNIINIDKFTIEQLRAAAMNKKETERLRLNMLRDALDEDEPNGYKKG